ncbi:WD40/YVTN/BNR-like repeat-containing protein [Sphingobacterium deserti]|uniref:Oxidoreductase n=1 Tax=Sphingobacterium deserti TaxID=1229276 RepID=A0A0B8T4W4_9SPHI|nr:YCF48-related protein [Sphingobacterium deserti]KGE12334.1 oxidoreductase [Sphingobacterium deserti]
MKKLLLATLTTFCLALDAGAQQLTQLTTRSGVSFRGIETNSDACIWVAGSSGTVGKSLDGGQTWAWVSPSGYEKFDFRDIEVFSPQEAVIVSAGTPAVVLRTADGGKSWQEVYRDERPEIFLDGMDFNGNEGFIVGDPIDGVFQLLQSKDKGKTWRDVSNFMFLFADSEEAAFAASGTSIQYLNDNVWIGTGGSTASIFKRNEKALTMDKYPCSILQGASSRGIFSIDFLDDNVGIAVGGDYQDDANVENTIMLTQDGGRNWIASESNTGFKSAVKYINQSLVVATGTSGTVLSKDAGQHWTLIAPDSFNSIALGNGGKTVYLTGSNGNIAKIDIE